MEASNFKMTRVTGSKMNVSRVAVTVERPHGIKYSLTLHAPDSTRLIGFDNAHGGIKPEGSRFLHTGKTYAYDHKHRHATDAGVLYEFDTAYQFSVTFMLRLIAF
jgi:hypothetical protein